MKPFIPPNATHLCEAIKLAAREWFADEIKEATLTPDENKAIISFSHAKSNLGVSEAERARLLSDDNRRYIDGLNEKTKQRNDLFKRAWDCMLSLLYSGELTATVIEESGGTSDVPAHFWGSREGQNYFAQYNPTSELSKARYHLSFDNGWGHRRRGTPFIVSTGLEAVLKGPAMPKATEIISSQESVSPVDAVPIGRNKRGASKKFDDLELVIQAARLIYEGFQPRNQAHLREEALVAYQKKTLLEPSEEWAKPIIRKLWNGLELERLDKKGG